MAEPLPNVPAPPFPNEPTLIEPTILGILFVSIHKTIATNNKRTKLNSDSACI